MTNASIGKTSEVGRAELEHFDVEEAIREVRRLGRGLIEATRHAKHRFREEWLEQLIERYRRLPGKPVIHLDDLSDEVVPTLSPSVRDMLYPHWRRLVEEFGYVGSMNRFRVLRDIVATGRESRWSKLGTWRRLTRLTGFRVNEMEPYVTAIRASSVGTTRVILRPKLPFNLATPWGAKIIGYRGDAAHATSAFHNMDPVLHEDYKRAITKTVGIVPFTTSIREADGYKRTNVGTFITLLTTIAGIDNTVRQKRARNPLPSWFFVSSKPTLVKGLKALYDAEGSATVHGVQLGQAVGMDHIETTVELPKPRHGIPVSKLEQSTQAKLLEYPPLVLVSTALCLYRLGILSYMAPQKVWKTRTDCTVFWNLVIHRMHNMRQYRDKVGFLSPVKKANLEKFTSPSSPSLFFSLEVAA